MWLSVNILHFLVCSTFAVSEVLKEKGETKAINDNKNVNPLIVADGLNFLDSFQSDSKNRFTVERHASVIARKGVENLRINFNITGNPSTTITTQNSTGVYQSDNKKTIPTSTTPINIQTISSSNNTYSNSTTMKNETSHSAKKKFHPKPTVTVAGVDRENFKPIHGLPTKSPPLGMATKINYVVPVIVSLCVLPLIIISGICLYKNGRDCWDKRHYRRMDFLIDGMYNE